MKKQAIIIISFMGALLFSQKANCQWEPCNNGIYGGNIKAVFIVGNYMFASSSEAGVYRSSDNGHNWELKSKGLSGTSIIAFTVQGSTIIAADLYGNIFTSIDYGEVWTNVNNGTYFANINDVVAKDNLVIVRGTYGSVYVSNDGCHSWQPKYNGLTNPSVHNINTAFITPNKLFIGTQSGTFVSTNNGDNWYHENNDVNFYESYSFASKGDSIMMASDFGIYYTTDLGKNWAHTDSGFAGLIMKKIYYNNGSLFVIDSLGNIFMSKDGGDNWDRDTIGLNSAVVNSLAFKDDFVLAGTKTGIFTSIDNGSTWISSNNGFGGLQCFSLYTTGQNLFVETLDYPIASKDIGNSWNLAMIDTSNSIIRSMCNIDNNTFVSIGYYGGSKLYVSPDAGNNWNRIISGSMPDDISCLASMKGKGSNNNLLFAGAGGLYVSTDDGKSWKSEYNGLPNATVTRICVSDSVVFVSLLNNGIYKSDDYGENWTMSLNNTTRINFIKKFGNYIYAGCDSETVYISSDMGLTWFPNKNVKDWYANSNSVTGFISIGPNILVGTYRGVFLTSLTDSNWIDNNWGLPNITTYGLEKCGYYAFVTTAGGIFRIDTNNISSLDVKDYVDSRKQLNIYPNPANTILHITIKDLGYNKINSIRVFSTLGREMYVKYFDIEGLTKSLPQKLPEMESQTIDISKLPVGVYYVEIEMGNNLIIEKFIKSE